jgi:hypothetical protein
MLQTNANAAAPMIAESSAGDARSRVRRFARGYVEPIRRFIVIAAIAFWLGGFTFYAGVAIPMGVEVLGTHRRVGFITERVTNWLNVAGVAALTIFLWNMILSWNARRKIVCYTLLITWLLMVAVEIELVSLHPVMDRLIGPLPGFPSVRTILDEDRFDLLHHVYLISTTMQWFIGMIHVWCICLIWQPQVRQPAESSLEIGA